MYRNVVLSCLLVQRLLTYGNAAEVLFGTPSRTSDPAGGGASTADNTGRLSVAVMRLMLQLVENLITKSKGYKSDPLASLFLMNNIHYIVWTVENSAALQLLGVDWLERHKDMIEDYGAAYHEATWMPIVQMLTVSAEVASIY